MLGSEMSLCIVSMIQMSEEKKKEQYTFILW